MSAETNSVVPAARRPARRSRRSSPCWRTAPRPSPRSARWSSSMGGWSATCAAGRSGRSPPTCACTATPRTAYCAAFGLERGQSLEGPDTRKLRAAALTSRLVFDVAFRTGSAAGRQRARAGELTRDAAAAATGRRYPEQRRRKARRALAGIPAEAVAQANAERASRHVAQVADEVARRYGYPDLGAFVLARMADGASLAAISREAGLHKDWLSRHLADVAPAAAAAVPAAAAGPARRPVAARAAPAGIRRRAQLPAGAPRQAAPDGQRHGRRDRRDPSRDRVRAAPSRPGPGRARGHPARGRRARRPGGRRARLRQPRAATCASAGRPAGRGGPWPPSPGSPSHGCAARPPGPGAGIGERAGAGPLTRPPRCAWLRAGR